MEIELAGRIVALWQEGAWRVSLNSCDCCCCCGCGGEECVVKAFPRQNRYPEGASPLGVTSEEEAVELAHWLAERGSARVEVFSPGDKCILKLAGTREAEA